MVWVIWSCVYAQYSYGANLTSDYKKITVSKFVIKGHTKLSTNHLNKLIESYLQKNYPDRQLSYSDLKNITQLITRCYHEKGYILAKAYFPQQDIVDGIVTIEVLEGKLDKIQVTGNTYYHEDLLKSYLKQQVKEKIIHESLLERGQLLINELPFSDTTMLLTKGEKQGTVDILLKTKDQFAGTCAIDYNNYGSETVSKNRYGVSFSITDPILGLNCSLRGISGDDVNQSSLGFFKLQFPVGYLGSSCEFSYLNSSSILGQELEMLDINGTTDVYSIQVNHPFIKKRTQTLSVSVGYERKWSDVRSNDEIITDPYKINTYSIGIHGDFLDAYMGKTIATYNLTFGEIQGNTSGYDKHFMYSSTSLFRIQKIRGYHHLILRASAQFSDNILPQLEQTVIGGYDTVRGHDAYLYMGNKGYSLSAEFNIAPPIIANDELWGQHIGEMMQLALFFDHAGIHNSSNTNTMDVGKTEELSGYGIGLRFYYKEWFQMKIDYAKPTKTIDDNDSDMFYFQTSWHY